jgi:hypothetical protein
MIGMHMNAELVMQHGLMETHKRANSGAAGIEERQVVLVMMWLGTIRVVPGKQMYNVFLLI